jgi:hypothetical protein
MILASIWLTEIQYELKEFKFSLFVMLLIQELFNFQATSLDFLMIMQVS